MAPFKIDHGWFDAYWYSDRPRPRRRSVPNSLARFAVVVVLLAGSGFALSHLQGHRDISSGLQDWEQE